MRKLLCEMVNSLRTNVCLSKRFFICVFGLLLLCVKVALLLSGVVDSSRELHRKEKDQLVRNEYTKEK